MYEYELQKIMQAELIRRADAERLAREARRAGRAARGSARKERERTVSADSDRQRFVHAA
ncbi:hypothetical protein AB0I93_36820 [Streptomyces sp. NPDC049967]|uniref:hypothetical protein n=1 Tax=unclassified Streptomyces TaxID=2593676 RepID=UPI00093A53D8|nr:MULTISPECIES: hypothetical protein [unclassified Streptomyces]OKK10488.1 hypothetical protein AMK09_32925 [Streptomyces sp. CB02488]WSJ25425.1 hypothetical protein OG384_27340 [Streptomyces sp. NBC_01324]